jgi:CheY-like chemotaxis protein
MSGATGEVSALLHELRNRLMPMQLRVDAGRHLASGTTLEPLMVSLQGSMQELTQWVDALQRGAAPSDAPVTEVAEVHDASLAAEPSPSAPLHVLLVDDNQVLADAMSDFALADARFASVRHARTAADAWQQLDVDEPQIVVLDVHLPDGDGIALCAALHDRYPTLSIAIMSGMFDTSMVEQSRAAGAAGFIAKGSDPRATLDAFVAIARGTWITLLP